MKVLKPQPELGEDRAGSAGSHLKALSSEPVYSPEASSTPYQIEWEDSLQDWINEQEGEAQDPPSGYTVTLELKEIRSSQIYTLLSDKLDSPGVNSFDWNGKDASGAEIPDGYYYWQLSAEAPSVVFVLPPEVSEDPEAPEAPPTEVTLTAPSYGGQSTRVILDRVAPEIVGIHALGPGKLAVEARDLVSGLGEIEAIGGESATRQFSSHPLHAAYALQPGDGEMLEITVVDWAGNVATDTVPLHPFVSNLGDQEYIPHASGQIAGSEVRINLTEGNGIQSFEGFIQKTPGFDLDFNLTYNHQSREKGSFGYGWSFSLDSRLKKWSDQDVTWHGLDGTLYWFHLEGGEYVTYAGGQRQHYPQLTYYSDGDQVESRYYVMEWPDQLRYRFSNDGKFWMIQDRNMNETFFEWIKWPTYHGYDYRIESVTDGAGHRAEFQYSPDTGNVYSTIIKEIDGAGNQAGTVKKFFFMYNEKGQFVGYREPSQKIVRFVYDDLHRISKVIDNGNNVREEEGETAKSVTNRWTYDDRNRVMRMGMTRTQDDIEEFMEVEYGTREATVRQPLGAYTLRWNSANRLTEHVETVQTAEGEAEAKTAFVFSANQLIRVTDPLERETRYRYNEKDNVIAEQSPSGRITAYTYDDQQDLLSGTGPLGYNVTYTYQKNLRKIVTKTRTQKAVDPAGVNPDQSIVTIEEFNDQGLPIRRTDGNGNVFDYTYDGNGFLTSDGTRVTYKNCSAMSRNGHSMRVRRMLWKRCRRLTMSDG